MKKILVRIFNYKLNSISIYIIKVIYDLSNRKYDDKFDKKLKDVEILLIEKQ